MGPTNMEILILNYDYPSFLSWFYHENPRLKDASYRDQLEARRETLMSGGVFYAKRLREMGHDVNEVYLENKFMQFAWAREHGLDIDELNEKNTTEQRRELLKRVWKPISNTPLRHTKRLVKPLMGNNVLKPDWYHDILEAQIRHYQPDVLYNRTITDSEFIERVDPYVDTVVGEIGTTIPDDQDLGTYDLILSILPRIVEELETRGIDSELIRRGFGTDVLDRLDDNHDDISVSFVGSLTPSHEQRIDLLESLCRQTPIRIWGTGVDNLDDDSPIHDRYQGDAWGIEMYDILNRSMVTVNSHIDVAGAYAANHRLFEATGVGTALVTDQKPNLHELFEPDEELLAYSSPQECASLVEAALEDESNRERLSSAGQRRTLSEHTYEHRMETIEGYLHTYC